MKKIFLIGGGKLSVERWQRLGELLDRYPSLRGFCCAKERIRELNRQESREGATRFLATIMFNLKSDDD